ncbi:MAG TPA: NAD-dependent epimerase/dehydratase family protein [Solirubrobacterales bacterium]|nr:NAD-dependent epimerase/dehydratase family protein [Solirubrobacterales bacterium]
MADARRGPIAITGASGQVGTLLRERLAQHPNEVRPLNQGDDWGAGIRGAETVVHLAGTLQPKGSNTYESANVDTTEAVCDAAAGAGVDRITFLSYLGASSDSRNAYLRSKSEAERLLAASGVPATIFRCVHVHGPPDRPGPTVSAVQAHGGRAAVVPGSGRQRIAPLYVGDVVDAVLGATLDADSPVGTFDLGGPDEMSLDELVRAVNAGTARLRHIPAPAARVVARLSPSLTPSLMDLLLRDNVPAGDPRDVGSAFGFVPTRFGDVWGATSRAGRTSP